MAVAKSFYPFSTPILIMQKRKKASKTMKKFSLEENMKPSFEEQQIRIRSQEFKPEMEEEQPLVEPFLEAVAEEKDSEEEEE